MQLKKRRYCSAGIASLVALLPLCSSPALAAQQDILIEQIGRETLAAPLQMAQIAMAAPQAFVTQVRDPSTIAKVSLQVSSVLLPGARAVMTDQVPAGLPSTGAPIELAVLGFGIDLGSYQRSGTGTSVIDDQAGNVWQQQWAGLSNLQFARQIGTNNHASQNQDGTGNVSLVFQNGSGNIADIVQRTDNGVATLLQNGERNSATVAQGSAFSFANISQSGIANIVSIRQ